MIANFSSQINLVVQVHKLLLLQAHHPEEKQEKIVMEIA
jgi:hypothetical protein